VRIASVLFAALVLVAMSGCGSRAPASKPEAAPDLLRADDAVGVLPDETLAVGEGEKRVVLVPSKGNAGQLCVLARIAGKHTALRCLGPGLPDPAVAFVGLGGKTPKRVGWASLIGLAREDVDRVSIQMQSGRLTPKLRRWPGFKWSLFSLEPGAGGTMSTDLVGGREVNRPNALTAFDAKGRKLIDLELSWVYGPCEQDDAACTGSVPAKSWQDVQDPFVGASGEDSVASRNARKIALRDPVVARLLAGRRYVFMPSSDWVDCGNSPIGVFLQVYVADPIAYEGDFPFESYNHASGKPYDESVWHLAFRNATVLDVSVDLHRKEVVGVDPTDSDDVQVDESKSHVVKEPAVPDDNLDCEGNPETD
jgi:hypothetical protein